MRYRSVDFNLLVVLDALLEHRSVSRAAEQLFVGQPAISAALARLRQHFDDPLLVQDGRRMLPTPRAQALQAPVRRAVQAAGHIATARGGFDPASTRQCFAVMGSDLDAGFLLPLLHQRLARLAPGARLQVLPHAPSGTAQEAFLRHGADLLLVRNEEADPAFPQQHLLDAPLATLVLGRHAEPGFTVDDTDGGEIIPSALGEGTVEGWRTEHLLALPALLSSRNLRVRLPEFVARRFCQRHPQLRMLHVPPPQARFRQVMQWPAHRDAEPAQVWLREQLLACAEQLMQPPVGEVGSIVELHPQTAQRVTAQDRLDPGQAAQAVAEPR